ncbi:MAG: hypothetical protein ACI9ON_000232 [Limisphaerales bacterium]|jgi:hypothetical protein
MNNRAPFIFLVTILIILGISAAAYRQQTYNIPWLPATETQVWQVEARIELVADGAASQVYLTLPPVQKGFELINEAAASSGWGFTIEEGAEQRQAHWTKRVAQGPQVLFYKLDFAASDNQAGLPAPDATAVNVPWDEPNATAVNQILNTIIPVTADAHSLAVQLIRRINQPDQNINLLTDQFDASKLLSLLMQTAGHHARTVQVLPLEDGRRRLALTEFVQVYDGEQWRLYNPSLGPVPSTENLLLWQTGAPSLIEVQGGTRSRVSFSISAQTRSGLIVAKEKVGDLALSLYNLPIAEQGMFKLIMLLPIGALVVVLLRVLIGVRTSGTFMPVLIALAFLQTQLLPGLASFIIVVAIGLFIRSYLSSLNLLLVARIATLVVIVIAIISIFSVISFRLGLLQGLTITFFPMIILAWTIERMSIIWEEEGPKEVLLQGGGSLFVAVMAFLLMDLSITRHLAFNFPELHLVVLAVILITGRYTGYRLLELHRFSAFKK